MVGDWKVSVSVTCAVATVAWLAGGLLMAGAVAAHSVVMGQVGLFVGMIGATATARCFFISLGRRVKNAMTVVAAGQGNVSSLSRLN